VLQAHYARNGRGPVAYIDETYSLQPGHRQFYVMTAVVVSLDDRDDLRKELDYQVPSGWWHTTEELRTPGGRERAIDMLRAFRAPDETCVLVDQQLVEDSAMDGESVREVVLGRLLEAVTTSTPGRHDPVRLVVMEERRERAQNNRDRRTRNLLVEEGRIPSESELMHASPGSEHLLWLPDVACSAYRHKMLFGRDDMFAEIAHVTTVLQVV